MSTVQISRPTAVPDSSRPAALRSGARVQVRALRSTDREHLTALFTRLSPSSRRDRFLTAMPRLNEQMLNELVDTVDGHNHVALALFSTPPGQRPLLIGVARFAGNHHNRSSAEIAVMIDDAWQGQGAGTLLTRELAAVAHRQGIGCFTATIRATHIRVLRMLQRVGTVVEWNPMGAAVECCINLPAMARSLDDSAA